MPMIKSIIVTGSPYSGKTTLAKLLAEHLKWKFFSITDQWKAEWKKKFPKGDTGFDNFMLQTTEEDHRRMDREAHNIIMKGNVVADLIYGFLYRNPSVLIVYTKCDIDERVKRALAKNDYPGKDFAQVKEILEQVERDYVDRCQALYQQDYREPSNYDLEFDTTNAAPDEALSRIISFIS
jgi:cytidylate kinase